MDESEIEVLKNIKELLEQIERNIAEIRSKINTLLGEGPEKPPDWCIPRVFVWYGIYNKGGLVSRDEFHRIGEEYGYDHRGLGGFFTGKEPSLRYVGVNKDTVALEDWAKDIVERYKDWIEQNKEKYKKK